MRFPHFWFIVCERERSKRAREREREGQPMWYNGIRILLQHFMTQYQYMRLLSKEYYSGNLGNDDHDDDENCIWRGEREREAPKKNGKI